MNKILPILLIALLCATPATASRSARLTNMVVANVDGDLRLSLEVEGAFRSKTVKAIQSGVPATFTFFINVKKARDLWPDRSISRIRLTHAIKYDNLKNEYVVTRSWEKEKLLTTRSFEEARAWMTRIEGLKIADAKYLKKNRRYRIHAKAELSKLKLPLHLHHVFLFVSFWDFETDWRTVRITY